VSGRKEPDGPTPAQILKDILRGGYMLHRTPSGVPFATDNTVPSVYMSMHELRLALTYRYFVMTDKAVPSTAITEAISVAESMAGSRPPETPYMRIAGTANCIYLDLGRRDGWAVELSGYGWRVVQAPPVIFRRTTLTGELPLPAEHGSADAARDLINIKGNDEWALYVACRIASLLPGITHPVEVFTGPAGSAKTATMRMSAQWIDPSHVMIPFPKDGRTWATYGANAYVLPVDNVSSIPAWWSDLLCKAASGDGWVDRALYTDGEAFMASFRSVVMINGITLGQLRGDLADRMVLHELTKPPMYRSDDDIEQAWQNCRPAALGWLLNQTVAVLRVMMNQPYPSSPHRLARFEQVVQVLDSLWHTDAAGAWRGSRREVAIEVVESDLVADAVAGGIQMPVRWTSQQVRDHLVIHGGLADLNGRPWSPRLLSEHLERATGSLMALGWTVRRYRENHSGRRIWELVPPGWYWDGAQWMFDTSGQDSLDRV
jgi:hypothetical protein